MLYGEVFADDIDPACGEDPSQPACVTGKYPEKSLQHEYVIIDSYSTHMKKQNAQPGISNYNKIEYIYFLL